MVEPHQNTVRKPWERQPDPGGQDGEIHLWFSLTYANYLVLRRSLLQSMPIEWQERFVGCLREFADAFSYLDAPDHFAVSLRQDDGRFGSDTIEHYNRGRTRILRRESLPEESS